MFGLDNLFAQTSAQKFYISRDRIAEILRVSPDALDQRLPGFCTQLLLNAERRSKK